MHGWRIPCLRRAQHLIAVMPGWRAARAFNDARRFLLLDWCLRGSALLSRFGSGRWHYRFRWLLVPPRSGHDFLQHRLAPNLLSAPGAMAFGGALGLIIIRHCSIHDASDSKGEHGAFTKRRSVWQLRGPRSARSHSLCFPHSNSGAIAVTVLCSAAWGFNHNLAKPMNTRPKTSNPQTSSIKPSRQTTIIVDLEFEG